MTSLDSSVEIVEVTGIDSTPVRQRRGIDCEAPSPRHALLESVSARFEQNRQDREQRIQQMRSKQDMEKVHSQYLKHNVASRYELDQARPVIEAWAQRNGRRRANLTERQRQRLMELETVDRRNIPVHHQRSARGQDMSNNADDYCESCSVIGCGVKFTCRQEHRIHNNRFEHSPCNPLLNMPNGCLPEHPFEYICPKCGEGFQRRMDCQEHMVMTDHLSLFSPLPICAYMCPQCLLFFPEKMRCHNHMEELQHFEPAYPFSDDLESDPSSCPRTIPVPLDLGQNFIQKVKDRHITFSVSCVECGQPVSSQQEMEQHQRETEESHLFTSSTQGILGDVFAEYLGDHTCNACLQIFTDTGQINEIHHCTAATHGILVDLNCQSFREFVRRSGLTLSRTVSDTVRPTVATNDTAKEKSPTITIDSASNSPVIMVMVSPNQTCQISSSSSSASSSPGTREELPGTKKRVHHVTILSSSSEDESAEKLTESARKRRRVEKSARPSIRESMFSQKMKVLASGLNEPNEFSSGFNCGARSLDHDQEESSSMKFRSQSEDSSHSTPTSLDSQGSAENLGTNGKPCLHFNVLPEDKFPTKAHTAPRAPHERSKLSDTASAPFKTPASVQSPEDGAAGSSCSSTSKSSPVQEAANSNQTVHSKDPRLTAFGASHPPLSHVSQSSRSTALCNSTVTAALPTSGQVSLPTRSATAAASRPFGQVSRLRRTAALCNSVASDTASIPSFGLISQSTRSALYNSAASTTIPPLGCVSQPIPATFCNSTAPAASSGIQGASRDPQNLESMKLIIFLDLDNWGAFFRKLPQCLPERTFVWAFYGGKNQWKPPNQCASYKKLLDSNCLHFHEQCGSSKDAADFAICLTVGKMDERLPKHIPFTILSGDKGFLEVERQMKLSTRRTVVIDPHNVSDKSNDVLYTMIISVIHD